MEGTAMTKSTLGRSGKSKLRLLFGASVSGAMLTTVLVAAPAGAQTAPLCEGRPATIVGTNGPDNLVGTNGDDVIVGLGGNDVINSLDGDDIVCGGDGNDLVRAGRGEDRVFGEAGNDVIRGQQSADFIDGGDGDDQLRGQNGADEINGGHGDDTILGGKGRDVIDGQTGNDDIGGGNHDDTVDGGYGEDFVRGGNGADTITGGAGNDNIRGGIGVDSIDQGFFFGDVINSGAGDDVLSGRSESTLPVVDPLPSSVENRESALRQLEVFILYRSRAQTILRLTSSGYHEDDALWAVENVSYDFQAHAERTAGNLLADNNMSEQRAFMQLHLNAQFTVEESRLAIENVNPDFVAEGMAFAEGLLEQGPVSRQALINLMTDDFFGAYALEVATEAIDQLAIDFNEQALAFAMTVTTGGATVPCQPFVDFLSGYPFLYTEAEAEYAATELGHC